MPKVKITVVKKVSNKDLYGDNPPAAFDASRITDECDRFELGQEFIVEDHNCPPGFCTGLLQTSRETWFMSFMVAISPG